METNVKRNQLICKVFEYIFLLLVIIQVGLLCYYNLSDIRYSLDYDAANAFSHFREVIRNGTLDIPGWHHTTTLEWDTAFLFAVPIYYVTQDLFLAAGISNIIYIVFYIGVIWGILHHAGVNRKFIYVTLTLALTPYSFGMLEYFNMLFFSLASYTVKVLVPLLLVWIILLFVRKEELTGWKRIGRACIVITYLGLLLVTSVSSGIYVMMCGIAPVVLCLLYDIWVDGGLQGKYNKKHMYMISVSVLIFFLGCMIHANLYDTASRTDMKLTMLENYAVNFRACIVGIFQVFGAAATEEISVMTPKGILYCLKISLVILLLICFVYNIRELFYKRRDADAKKYLTFLFLFNFMILLICDTRYTTNTTLEYRYYLIGAVPLLILFGIQMSQWHNNWNAFRKNLAYFVFAGALTILVIGNNKNLLDNWDRSSYAVELCEYFESLEGIESVFFVDDSDTSDICRAIDGSRRYGTYMSKSQSLYLSNCNYEDSQNAGFYGDRNAVAVFIYTQLTDYMPEEIAAHYTKAGTVRYFDIYVSEQVYF